MEIIHKPPVSVEVVERIRSEGRRLIERVVELRAELENGRTDRATSVAASVLEQLKEHCALVDGVLDAITTDQPRRRRRVPTGSSHT